jgi:endoglucanase
MKIIFTSFFLLAASSSLLLAQDIFVNQAGYLAGRQKLVYFDQPADSFYIIDKTSGKIQFSGSINTSKINDPATGMNVYYGDFSMFTKEGIYEIKDDSNKVSYPFEISSDPFKDVYKKSLKGFYFQRCGIKLLPEYADKYARPACHLNDGVFEPSTGLTGYLSVTGGWHDAGDFGKYVVNAGITIGTLLLGYEIFPDNFSSDDLNIPESGNSIPDILDEVKYELEWLLKMQDSDGGVFFKVTPKHFSGFIMPESDSSARYIYQKSTAASGDFAAMMAMAARIYPPFDSLFAIECLKASEKSWHYLESNPSIIPEGGFHNPPGTSTGQYGDRNDSDERLWAAAELFITTGDSTFGNYFSGHYQNFNLLNSTMGWPNVAPIAELDYLFSSRNRTDTAIKSELGKGLINYCSKLYSISKNDGFNVSLNLFEYNWGSNGVVMNNAVMLIMGYQLTGNKDFLNSALEQFNYILGCNGNNISYITGIGSKSVMHPHHRTSAADGIAEPVPGLLAGGPNRYLTDKILKSKFSPSTPPGLCYSDTQESYASNEIAINWNAPLVFVAGFFSGDKYINELNRRVIFNTK